MRSGEARAYSVFIALTAERRWAGRNKKTTLIKANASEHFYEKGDECESVYIGTKRVPTINRLLVSSKASHPLLYNPEKKLRASSRIQLTRASSKGRSYLHPWR